MAYPVKIVCMVCKKDLGHATFTAEKPDLISHGICTKCYEIKLKELDELEITNGT